MIDLQAVGMGRLQCAMMLSKIIAREAPAWNYTKES